MIFGKDKKTPFTNPLSRPLESAALGRWRTLNESSNLESREVKGQDLSTERVDDENESPPTPFLGLAEAEDFIQEQIPLISLDNPIVETVDEEEVYLEEHVANNPVTLSLEEDIEDNDSSSDLEDYDDDYSEDFQTQTNESIIETSEITEPPSPPVAPPREKTLMGDFGISVEDDIKNRFGSNLKSALGHGTVIEGMFSFENPVKIDGSLKGEIRSSSALIVGPEAQVNARIKVGTLIVLGSVQGEIEAEDLIEVRSTGCLDGDLVTRRFALEEGGIFNGACTMIE